jgi:hypothetical protein
LVPERGNSRPANIAEADLRQAQDTPAASMWQAFPGLIVVNKATSCSEKSVKFEPLKSGAIEAGERTPRAILVFSWLIR